MKKPTKKIKIGIMPWENFKEYTLSVASGKHKHKQSEPKIWFTSIQSLANVLSEQNQALLKLIIDEQPQSISELEKFTQRKANNILRTLRTMENYGLVELTKGNPNKKGRTPLIPKVPYDTLDIQISLNN